MKLTTKIAGSMALPLALAVAANSAQAFTVVDNDDHTIAIGGYLSAITSWNIPDADGYDENNRFSAGTSRLNLSYTDKATGTKFFYEQQFVGGQANDLRHAYFETADGLVAGHTWSFGTNNVARIETIETTNNRNVTDQYGGPRNLLLGQRFTVADGMKVGISLENQNDNENDNGFTTAESVMPAVTANFDGQFGDARVFAAWTNFAARNNADSDDERNNRLTLGASVDLGAATIRAGVTHLMLDDDVGAGDDKTAASVGVGFKINEQVRVNAAVEHVTWDKAKNADATSLWLNAFYLAQNGVEWGAELQYVSADDNVGRLDTAGHIKGGFNNVGHDDDLIDKDVAIRLQAKYAF